MKMKSANSVVDRTNFFRFTLTLASLSAVEAHQAANFPPLLTGPASLSAMDGFTRPWCTTGSAQGTLSLRTTQLLPLGNSRRLELVC